MNLATDRIRRLARARGMTLGALLERARVSRTAYYSLARRRTVLPRSVLALAKTLDVYPQEILDGSAIAQDLDSALLGTGRVPLVRFDRTRGCAR